MKGLIKMRTVQIAIVAAVIAMIYGIKTVCLTVLVILAILATIAANGSFAQRDNPESIGQLQMTAQNYLREHPSFSEANSFKEQFYVLYFKTVRYITLDF